MEQEEITNIEIYRLKFILKRHAFVLHVTSVFTGSVQIMHHVVGARTMQDFRTDLLRNLIRGELGLDQLICISW